MNELDKIFQSKLENHTADYSEQSWDKIQARLMQQKSKPKKLPWLWMSLIIALIVGLIYLWSRVDDQEPTSKSNSANPMAVNADGQNSGIYNNGANDKITAIAELAEAETNESITASEEGSMTIVDQSNTKQLAKVNVGETNRVNKNRNGQSVQNDVILRNGDLGKDISILNSPNPSSKVIVDDNQTNEEGERQFGLTVVDVEGGLSNLELANLNLKSNEIKIRPLRTIGVSAYTTLQSEKSGSKLLLSKSMLDDFRQDCPSFVTDRTGVYLDFYLSHELPFRSLKSRTQELEPYASLRSNSEGPTYSFSAGVRLTLMLPNGLGLKTGLNYSQVNEKFTFTDTDSDIVKEVTTKTTVNGVMQFDTNTVIIPGTREIVSTNKYRSFDIPLLLSYEWDVMERTYMTVNGGAYLNLLFKESGKILSPSGEVIDLADNSGDKLAIFKNNIGLSLFGSVGLHYRMNGNIDLILEPNIRLLVKSATIEAYPLEHKWFTVGLITGVRYNF